MKNGRHTISGKPTRRTFVAGSAALLGSAAIMPSSLANEALIFQKTGLGGSRYQCSQIHAELNRKLTRIVADETVSREDTALALRSTFCPCCNVQINASYPVMPSISRKQVV